MGYKSKEHLSSTQKKVRHPRRCIYAGEHKNTDITLARDILSLYITCKLGYSPIRHILGLSSDKKVEDVIRQHMLGRKCVDGSIGELYCPGSATIEECYKGIIQGCIKKYNTQEDPYNKKMMTTGKWTDDPIHKKSNKCPHCNTELQPEWVACPYCGRNLSTKQKSLF